MDVLREALLVGLGAIDYSRERLKEVVSALREQGELSKEQAEKLIEELKKRGMHEEEEIEKTVSSATEKARSAFPFPTHEDLAKIEKRLAKLEKAVKDIKGSVRPQHGSGGKKPTTGG